MANLKPYFRQKGATLIMTAFLLPVLFAALGGALDLGNLYVYKSQLQNVADSAALAGVSSYNSLGGKVKYRLADIPSDLNDDGGFSFELDDITYHFVPVTDTAIPDRNAKSYVDVNTSGDRKLSLDTLKAKDTDTTKLWYDEDTKSYCYLVRLQNTIPTYFIRYFGIDSLTTESTAVAMAYMPKLTQDDINEVIIDTSRDIARTVPNYYWESIVGWQGATYTVSIDKAKEQKLNLSEEEKMQESDLVKTIFGLGNSRYYANHHSEYKITTIENRNSPIIAYKDRTTDSDSAALLDKFCAEPIYADNGKVPSDLVNLVYTLNKKTIQKNGEDNELTGIFLDRPNINSSNVTGNDGKTVHAKKIRGTVLNITSEEISKNNSVPVYLRFESEPIKFGSATALVQPITINVNGYQEKPMIIAYDGPDPARKCSHHDAPYVMTSSPTTLNNYADNGVKNNLSKYTLTSMTVSAPITINLNYDFNGVIYAPFSQITIEGSGKINGFVMAARIIDNGTSSTRGEPLQSSEVSLPIWETKHTGGNNFAYTVSYVKAKYNITYDALTYYTNRILTVNNG